MIKYVLSKNVLLIAQQYLKHEFRKIFNDIGDFKIWRQIDKSIEGFIKREDEVSFWELVAAISEGWKLKTVHHYLFNSKYNWKLKKIPFSKVVLTGMSPVIDEYTIKKFNRNPLAFAKSWKIDKEMRRKILKTGLSPHKERDHFPILVFQSNDGFRIFDGMRRTLLALINNETEIKAWVGYEANPRGKPLVSGNRCYFLSNVYTLAKRKDKNLERSIVRMGKEIIFHYRNGRDVLIKRIAGWSYNPEIRRIFKKMIK